MKHIGPDILIRIRLPHRSSLFYIRVRLKPYPAGKPDSRGVQDQDFGTQVQQDSAYFEHTGSGPGYVFFQVSGSESGFSNFIVFGI